MKLDVNTHLPDYDYGSKDDIVDETKVEQDKNDLVLITDAFMVSDISIKLSEIKRSLEYNCNNVKGVLRYKSYINNLYQQL